MEEKILDKKVAEPVRREVAEPVPGEVAEPVRRKRGRPRKRPYDRQEEKQRRHDRDMAAIRNRKPEDWQVEEFKAEEGLLCMGRGCMMYSLCRRPLPGDRCDAMF